MDECLNIEEVEKNKYTKAYFYSNVYQDILNYHNKNLFIVFADWDKANQNIKKVFNEKVRKGTMFNDNNNNGKLMFNLASETPKNKFERKNWETFCDKEVILFLHEIKELNLNID